MQAANSAPAAFSSSADQDYLHAIAQRLEMPDPAPLDIPRLTETVTRLGIAIANQQTNPATTDLLERDLKVIKSKIEAKTDWNEIEQKAFLPAHLKQGLASCINLLRPCIPDEILTSLTFHEGVLRTAISRRDASNSLTPRGCVRQYCLDILQEACRQHRQPLYFIRQSSSVTSGGEEKPSVIITYTKNYPPATNEDVSHTILYWNQEKTAWQGVNDAVNDTAESWPTVMAYVHQYLPGMKGLVAPTERDVNEYVAGYYSSTRYTFNALSLDNGSPTI